jgi:hypothetical protein
MKFVAAAWAPHIVEVNDHFISRPAVPHIGGNNTGRNDSRKQSKIPATI